MQTAATCGRIRAGTRFHVIPFIIFHDKHWSSAVGDWLYGVAAGIDTVEEAPGFEKVIIAPHPDVRLSHLTATIETRHGKVLSHWERFENGWRYEIETPVEATVTIDGKTKTVQKGRYIFYS